MCPEHLPISALDPLYADYPEEEPRAEVLYLQYLAQSSHSVFAKWINLKKKKKRMKIRTLMDHLAFQGALNPLHRWEGWAESRTGEIHKHY